MQKKHGFKPLGAANGPVTAAIFGGNVARLYDYPVQAYLKQPDHFAQLRAEYEAAGTDRSNLRYGYIPKPAWNCGCSHSYGPSPEICGRLSA
jgi:hypothetical protein